MKHLNNSDYYFHAGVPANHNDDPPIAVLICPKDYFDSNGHLKDSHLSLEIPGMVQVEESIFHIDEASLTLEVVREQLLNLGFVESKEFSKFCSTHDPFV